jgi:hypothetical protein
VETRDWWANHAQMSSRELAEELGIDGGSARRLIRKAKEEYDNLPWRNKAETPDALVRFLSRGHTESEIADKGYSLSDARKVTGHGFGVSPAPGCEGRASKARNLDPSVGC